MPEPQIKMEITGDEKGLVRALRASERQVDRLKEKLAQTGRTSKQVGGEMNTTFGAKAAGDLKRWVGGLVSAGAAIGVITRGLNDLRRMEKEATARMGTAEDSRRALLQVSGGDATTYGRLLFATRQLRVTHGIEENAANRIVFNAQSAGLLKQWNLFGHLQDVNFDPSVAIKAVQKMQAGFGGVSGAGTARQILNKLLVAGESSPSRADELAEATTVAAADFGKRLGGSDESLLAILQELSKVYTTPKGAAEKIKTLAASIADRRAKGQLSGAEGVAGLDLILGLPSLFAGGNLRMPGGRKPTSIAEWLGSQEAIGAYEQVVSKQGEILQTRGDIIAAQSATGTPKGMLTRQFAISDADTVLQAQKRLRILQERAKISEEGALAAPTLLADMMQEEQIAHYRNRLGVEPGSAGDIAVHWAAAANRWLHGTPRKYLAAHLADSNVAKNFSPELRGMTTKFFGGTPEYYSAGDFAKDVASDVQHATGNITLENLRELMWPITAFIRTFTDQTAKAVEAGNRRSAGAAGMARPMEDR